MGKNFVHFGYFMLAATIVLGACSPAATASPPAVPQPTSALAGEFKGEHLKVWMQQGGAIAPQKDVDLVLQPTSWFQGEEAARHAAQVGHDPTLVFQVDDCRATYARLAARGVEFSLPPTERGYGIEADARDMYGNMLVFIQLPGAG